MTLSSAVSVQRPQSTTTPDKAVLPTQSLHGHSQRAAALDKAGRKHVIVQTHRAQTHLLAPCGSPANHRWDPANKRHFSWNKDRLNHAWQWAQRLCLQPAANLGSSAQQERPCWLLVGLTSGLVLGAGVAHADRVLTRACAEQTATMNQAERSQVVAAAILLDTHDKEIPSGLEEMLRPMTRVTQRLLSAEPAAQEGQELHPFRSKLFELLACGPHKLAVPRRPQAVLRPCHNKPPSSRPGSSRRSSSNLSRRPSIQSTATYRSVAGQSSDRSRPHSRQSIQTVYSNSSSPRTTNFEFLWPDPDREPWSKVEAPTSAPESPELVSRPEEFDWDFVEYAP